MQNKIRKSHNFFYIYKEVKKIYEKIFISNTEKKLYWFGVSCLPLIYFVSTLIYSFKIKRKAEIRQLNLYNKSKISYEVFETSILKKFLQKVYFFFLILFFFFKKKIFVVHSRNNFTNEFCKKKKFFKILFDPLWLINKKELNQTNCDKLYLKKIEIFTNKITKTFFLDLSSVKKKNLISRIENQFSFYYKIYLLLIDKTKNYQKYSFITSYTGIIYVRLFLSALRFNKKGKIFTLTHGEVEALNQLPHLEGDPCLLGNFLVLKSSNYKKKYEKFFSEINKNYIQPKFVIFKNNQELKNIKKNYFIKRKPGNKIIIVGYPRSYHFNVNFSQIVPIDYYKLEIQLMKKLVNLGYDVTYKIHPDRIDGNKHLFKNFKTIEGSYEAQDKFYNYSIFTYHRSTALGYALKNNSPIMVLSYKNLDMDRYTYKMLSKRISFIDLSYKNNNISLKISNSNLKKKIDNSKKLVSYNPVLKFLS